MVDSNFIDEINAIFDDSIDVITKSKNLSEKINESVIKIISCLKNNGKVIGVIPKILYKKEIINTKITKLYTVKNMHERKQKMYDLSDVFIALPGGIGTLEEISEEMSDQVTIAQLNIDSDVNSATKYGIRGIPTMLLFKDGELKATKVGATTKSNIVSWIKENI